MAPRSTMEEEFREFVAARSAALLRTAYLLAGDWATAEDLLQTALTKTYLAWKRLGEIEAVEPYARRVLVNTATSWWRRKWHGERPTETLPERAEPDRLDEQLDRDALWQHVKALPARQRAVLVLRFYEDLSEAQTAALLGISVGTVKSQTSRALGSLRQRLTGEGLEPSVRRAGPAATAPRNAAARSAARPQAASAETVPAETVLSPPADSAVAEPAAGPPAQAGGGQTVVSPRPAGGVPAGLPTALPAPAVGLEG